MAVTVTVGKIISAVADGTMTGALVGKGVDVGKTVGRGVAFEQAVRRVKRRGRIFFMFDLVGAGLRPAPTRRKILRHCADKIQRVQRVFVPGMDSQCLAP